MGIILGTTNQNREAVTSSLHQALPVAEPRSTLLGASLEPVPLVKIEQVENSFYCDRVRI